MIADRVMRGPDSGFSLLEVVVAVAVFSLGALAVINVLGQSSRETIAADERALAGIVAENQIALVMAETRPVPLGVTQGSETMLGRTWRWEMAVTPTPEPRIQRIDVRVRTGEGAHTLTSLSSFRALK